MSISMYSVFIPGAVRALTNLIGVLEKVAAHAEARKIDPQVFSGARLFPDMYPLSRQVQIASDMVKGGAARLAGQEPPKWEDTEQSFADLVGRVRKTIDFLNSFTPAQIDGSETRSINLTMRGNAVAMEGQTYLLGYVLPNMYFHITTAYAIARSNGVDLGKPDFIGKLY